jgi:single-stranded DNA-binding protein
MAEGCAPVVMSTTRSILMNDVTIVGNLTADPVVMEGFGSASASVRRSAEQVMAAAKRRQEIRRLRVLI